MALTADGDRDAFAELVGRHQKTVLSIAFRHIVFTSIRLPFYFPRCFRFIPAEQIPAPTAWAIISPDRRVS